MARFWNRATWPTIGVIFFAQLAVLLWMAVGIYPRIGGDGEPLDKRLGLSADEVVAFVASLEPAGKEVYVFNELVPDILYPLLYGAFLALVLRRGLRSCVGESSPWVDLALVPFAAAAFDIVENLSIVSMLTGVAEPVGLIVAANALKYGLIAASFMAIVVSFALGRRASATRIPT